MTRQSDLGVVMTTHNTSDSQSFLDPSELGTKVYWDNVYARELLNHQEDKQDEGTIWFEESNAEQAVLRQLNDLADQGFLRRDDKVGLSTASRFLDLGTGNGHMLFALRDADEDDQSWQGEMVGVDYSESSVHLARRILAQQSETENEDDELANHVSDPTTQGARFEVWDLLSSPPGDWLQDGFDVVLDKGTFDAISLMPAASATGHPCETYRDKVIPLIKSGHFLIVTSCNWTKAELINWLAPKDGGLDFFSEAHYPTFTFGGHTGQSIVTVVFRKGAVSTS